MTLRSDVNQVADSYPYVTGMGFRSRCHMICDEFGFAPSTDITGHGQCVFVKTDFVKMFEEHVLPNINFKVNLITHNSAIGIDKEYVSLLENPKIIHWHAQNANFKHPKLSSIPLGLANYRWTHGNYKIIEEVNSQIDEKPFLIYMNFDSSTNEEKRIPVQKRFADKDYVKKSGPKPYGEYLEDLRRSKFTISPPGAGIDCHRIWESVAVGTVPIVENCHNISFYEDMPILIIENWDEVQEEHLNEQYDKIINKSKDKLYLDYWVDKLGLL